MKKITKFFAISAVAISAGCGFQACVSENPFSQENKVLVKMNIMVNPSVTRSTPANEQYLRENCVVYVSSSEGLLHKWTCLDSIPEAIYMRYGSYIAEAWTGDSVSAAYESENKKFYKGEESFYIDGSSSSVQVNLRCTLANVVASVEQSTIDNKYIKDVTVSFSNSRGELSFDSDNWSDKGYFMMPNGDSELKYLVKFKNAKGKEFEKEGVISDVKSAFEYRLNFEYTPGEATDGGAIIQIIIEELEVVNDSFDFLGGPEFCWSEDDVAIGGQIISSPGNFITHHLRVAAYGDSVKGFKSINVTPVDPNMFKDVLAGLAETGFDIIQIIKKENKSLKSALSEKGINFIKYDPDPAKDISDKTYVHKFVMELSDKWLNSLPESDKPYELYVSATDSLGKTSNTVISIANTNNAITKSCPIVVDKESLKNNFMAIGARKVILPLSYENEEVEDLTNVAIQYRKKGDSEWITQSVELNSSANVIYVEISGLEPGTTYEYRTVCGTIEKGKYELESTVSLFTTESIFIIPNASMEEWSTYSAKTMLGQKTVILPGTTGDKSTSFWGSGNEGAATASLTLTNKSTDMIQTGQYSARLASASAMGVIAAGNLFVGEYVKTDGTNGVLSVGREYNGSHPTKLRVYANYRPGSGVTVKSGNEKFVPSGFAGSTDHGQIYVALTDEPVEIRTNPDDRKLFDTNDSHVLAYGEISWTDNFAPDGQLEMIEIPLEYFDRAKKNKATHLVIVCSASKYGDYFCGSKNSVMYLDDFELVYE